ncbi:protein of unknown function [Xenorhabdus nematophila AN6/1]|nr:hypothetical protein XNW1_1730018 [Xenorhabdus nematophila str. Websteri]CEF29756.1 hypothetical protein XNW1_20018 [Xenorhabdus nematophila str. Websteri]CEK21071.1 protein of unknown function [Xenorhabdus nematophila AN6/1]
MRRGWLSDRMINDVPSQFFTLATKKTEASMPKVGIDALFTNCIMERCISVNFYATNPPDCTTSR